MNRNIGYLSGNITIKGDFSIKRWGWHRLDLHGLNQANARNMINKQVRFNQEHNCREILLIHGYHNGTILRNYIRNGELEQNILDAFPNIFSLGIYPVEEGATKIVLKWRKTSGNN